MCFVEFEVSFLLFGFWSGGREKLERR